MDVVDYDRFLHSSTICLTVGPLTIKLLKFKLDLKALNAPGELQAIELQLQL